MKPTTDQASEWHIAEDTVAAPEPQQDRQDQAVALLESLADEPDTARQLELMETAFDQAGDIRAAACLRKMLLQLEGTAAGIALQRVVLGDNGESLRNAGLRASVSKVAIWLQEKTIRKRLRLPKTVKA